MPRCLDCGHEETKDYLFNGYCEDCLEDHNSLSDSIDEMNNTFHYDPVRNLFPLKEE